MKLNMIDTDDYQGHTEGPWMVDEGQDCGPTVADIRQADGPTVIATVVLDDDYDLELKNEMYANIRLIADAPLFTEEVKQLRGQLEQAREFLWWCYDKERFGWEIDEKGWNLIGRLLGADTDHNDNEWSEDGEQAERN